MNQRECCIVKVALLQQRLGQLVAFGQTQRGYEKRVQALAI